MKKNKRNKYNMTEIQKKITLLNLKNNKNKKYIIIFNEYFYEHNISDILCEELFKILQELYYNEELLYTEHNQFINVNNIKKSISNNNIYNNKDIKNIYINIEYNEKKYNDLNILCQNIFNLNCDIKLNIEYII
jgi:hypothetical protein